MDEPKLNDIGKIAEYLQFLQIAFFLSGIIALVLTGYLAGSAWQLSAIGTEVAGIEKSLANAVSILLLLGILLILISVVAWRLASRIKKIMEESQEDIRAITLKQALRRGRGD